MKAENNKYSIFLEIMDIWIEAVENISIQWSIHTFWYEGLAQNDEKIKFQQNAISQKKQPRLKGWVYPTSQQINDIDISQMQWCTRYKSNTDEQIW